MGRQPLTPLAIPRTRNAGFTLMEVMVALVVLLFGVITMASLSAVVVQSNRGSTNRTRADEALYQKVEQFQSMPYQAVASGSDAVTVGNVRFNRSWVVEPNTPAPNVMRISLRATWVERADTFRVSTSTLKGQT